MDIILKTNKEAVAQYLPLTHSLTHSLTHFLTLYKNFLVNNLKAFSVNSEDVFFI